jgi:hypothetical protein
LYDRTSEPSPLTANRAGGLPESLWTQKIPGCLRLLTIPEASTIAGSSSRPTRSIGDAATRENQTNPQAIDRIMTVLSDSHLVWEPIVTRATWHRQADRGSGRADGAWHSIENPKYEELNRQDAKFAKEEEERGERGERTDRKERKNRKRNS